MGQLNYNIELTKMLVETRDSKIVGFFKLYEDVVGGSEGEKINPDVENKLKTGEHPLGDNPAFPQGDEQGEAQQRFEELVGQKRFQDVIESLKRYTGKTQIDSVQEMSVALIGTLNQILQIEAQNKAELENLAVELIKAEFNIPDGEVQFSAQIVGNQTVDIDDIPDQPANEAKEVEQAADFDQQVAKRRFINALTQGAAVKTTYAYHLIKDRLDQIDSQLIDMYSLVSVFSEFGYWVISTAESVEKQPGVAASASDVSIGKSQVDLNQDPPKVTAAAVSFPYLIHELAKGVMELLSSHGLPEDPKQRQQVISKADFLDAEYWDLRIGPGLWERFVDMVGAADEQDVRTELYTTIVSMPPEKFNKFVQPILARTEQGKKNLKQLADHVRQQLD